MDTMFNYNTLKSWMFKIQPESAHHLAEVFLQLPNISPLFLDAIFKDNFISDPKLHQDIFNVKFLNPVGLGAGFDKNATMIRGIKTLGFGFTEVGTITPKAQSGNPKPRMFRHVRENSLQNAMGFNNDGLLKAARRLKKIYPCIIPIGINIGKNKMTTKQNALSDYKILIQALHKYSDYITINISSPNTPGLRDLQNNEFIKALFGMAKDITNKPVLLKIAPDMSAEEAVDLSAFAVEMGAAGIIATNTTTDYSLVQNPYNTGGLSGEVLKSKSFEMFEAISKELFGKTTLVSVGGIDSAQEAYKRIKAGASLVQIYTALIFKGPNLIKEINKGLLGLLRQDGYTHISQAIGADRK